MSKPNRKKFERGEDRDPLRLQPRDITLIHDVSEFRFLNTEQFLALHEGGRRNIMERLSRLYQHGYLDRPEAQKAARLTSAHTVYSLGRKSVEVLAKDAQERERFLRRIREINKTLPIIAHAMMISQFRVCLTLAVKKHANVKLTRWTQGNDLKVALSMNGRSPKLVPDAFFTLDDGRGAVNCFLEVDRGTETTWTFVRKLKTYWTWKDNQKILDALGITRFRVLTVASTEGRSESLRRAGKEGDPKAQGSLMFLFAPETGFNIDTRVGNY